MPRIKPILLIGVISAVLILFILGVSLNPAKESISIAGNQLMTSIVRDAGEEFLSLNPDLQFTYPDLDFKEALAALRQGKIDIALGRDIHELSDPGLRDLASIKEYTVARHGVIVVAHKQTPGTGLSIGDLGKIYRKEIRNWKELGGSDMPIILVGLQQQNLTRSIFHTLVFGEEETRYPPDIRAADDKAVLDIVAANPGAIGFTNFGIALSNKGKLLDPVNVLPVIIGGDPIAPTKSSILDGTYPLYGNLSAYVREDSTDSVRGFIDFLTSPDGMTFIENKKEIALFDETVRLTQDIDEASIIYFPGYYRLTKDLKECPKSSCIRIVSSDVFFDGMGHTLTGSNGPRANGIEVGQEYVPVSNVTIRNLSVKDFNRGIVAKNAYNLTIDSVTASKNRLELRLFRLPDPSYYFRSKGYGLQVMQSSNVSITHSTFSENGNDGIIAEYSCNLTIAQNTVTGNSRDGIHLLRAKEMCPGSYTMISGNTLNGNGRMGITANTMRFIQISGNILRNNGYKGISLWQSEDILVTDNILVGNRFRSDYFQGKNITLAGNEETSGPYWVDTNLSILFLTLLLGATRFINKLVARPFLDRVRTWVARRLKLPGAIGSRLAVGGIARFQEVLHHPAVISAIAAVTLGVSFFITKPHFEDEFYTLASFVLLGLVVSVVPKLSQYLFARRYAITSTFRLWWTGILFMFLSSVVIQAFLGITFVYGQPLKSLMDRPDATDTKRYAFVSLFGIVSGLLVTFSFFCLYFFSVDRVFQYIAITGFEMGILTAVITLLPFPPMDGERIKNWNRWVWAALFIPLFILYLAQFMFYEAFMYFL